MGILMLAKYVVDAILNIFYDENYKLIQGRQESRIRGGTKITLNLYILLNLLALYVFSKFRVEKILIVTFCRH